MHDKQPLGVGKGGADHTDPQNRQRGGDALADGFGYRIVPGTLQAKTERRPQHRQWQRHQNRPEHGANRQEKLILSNFADPAAGPGQEGVVVLAGTDAENHQQQGAEDGD
ncbi:hypothetical protein D3C73_1032790 [compost metagenome]